MSPALEKAVYLIRAADGLLITAGAGMGVDSGLLNDTGITFCANNDTILADCAPATLGLWATLTQDAQRGRDALAAQGTLAKAGAGNAGAEIHLAVAGDIGADE